MADEPVRLVVDVASGEVEEVPLTKAEKTQLEQDQAEAAKAGPDD